MMGMSTKAGLVPRKWQVKSVLATGTSEGEQPGGKVGRYWHIRTRAGAAQVAGEGVAVEGES